MTLPQSRILNFDEIPVVDIGSLVSGKPNQSTLDELDRACRDVGFFYVSHHGMDMALVDNLLRECAQFFNKSMEEKQRIKLDARMRGYLPLEYRSFEGEANASTNHQEGFWIGHELPLTTDDPLAGPNQWLEDGDALKQAMDHYFVSIEMVATALMRGFALALDLSESTFVEVFQQPNSRLKLNHYPLQENPTSEFDIGVLPHADSGGFTVLWQDDSGGLEIQNRDGEWIGAPPIPGTFVINLGKVMQQWTNGYYSATLHRVVNRSGGDRYSIPLFVNPSSDAVIDT
ncbi:MAG: 2OG-Fe(II) oxygenase family protein, partial [Pseudomonadota bacterium]